MSIIKILGSLGNSWERNKILDKIKNGQDTDQIVDEFIFKNQSQLKELKTLLRPEDINLLNQVEKLSTCEAKLINKINNLDYLKNHENRSKEIKEISSSNNLPTKGISLFMINWSNKFVIIALLTISAVALSKQAWT